MLKKTYVVVASSEKEVYRLMRVAANHHLYGTYKIGVYGCERQHELFLTGSPWNYRKFTNEVNRTCENAVDSEEVKA